MKISSTAVLIILSAISTDCEKTKEEDAKEEAIKEEALRNFKKLDTVDQIDYATQMLRFPMVFLMMMGMATKMKATNTTVSPEDMKNFAQKIAEDMGITKDREPYSKGKAEAIKTWRMFASGSKDFKSDSKELTNLSEEHKEDSTPAAEVSNEQKISPLYKETTVKRRKFPSIQIRPIVQK